MSRHTIRHQGSLQAKVPDMIAHSLREQIVNQPLAVNDKLPTEKELIEQFGASRGSVREALKSLEVQGLIYNVPGPGGGARVREVEEERVFEFMRNFFHFRPVDGEQMYAVRRLVEPETAVSVIGELTEADFERLQQTIDEICDGDDARDWARHRSAEIEFHDILAERCPNPLLAMIAKFVNSVIRSAAESSYPTAEDHEAGHQFRHDNLDAHRAILAALRAGDAPLVRQLMADHIAVAEKFVVAIDARQRQRPRSKGRGPS